MQCGAIYVFSATCIKISGLNVRCYCKFGNFRESFVRFRENKILKLITLSFTDIFKSCPSRKFIALQLCYSMLFAKKNSRENFQIYSYLPDSDFKTLNKFCGICIVDVKKALCFKCQLNSW